MEICTRQRGLADSYHQTHDRSPEHKQPNDVLKLVQSSCSGLGQGWVGWQGSCCMHSGVRRRTRDTWTTLALGGRGLAVGVVTEVGFTEEPWAAFSSAGCEGHALQYWGRRGRERKHVTPETLPSWGGKNTGPPSNVFQETVMHLCSLCMWHRSMEANLFVLNNLVLGFNLFFLPLSIAA